MMKINTEKEEEKEKDGKIIMSTHRYNILIYSKPFQEWDFRIEFGVLLLWFFLLPLSIDNCVLPIKTLKFETTRESSYLN